MTKDEYAELFETQTRGIIATAFVHAQMSPDEYWSLIRGEREITMRDLAKIGHTTGYHMHMQLVPHLERPSQVEDEGDTP